MTTKVLVIDVRMANIIPPLVSSSPPPMDSDDDDDDDFGDFANANDLSSYDCDASSLPSSPQLDHKRLDFPEDPSGVSFPEDCPAERNDPKDNTSQDSVISIVTSDSGLSSEINSSSGEDAVNEITSVTRTDAVSSSKNIQENFNHSQPESKEEAADHNFTSDFPGNGLDCVNVCLNVSENVNGDIYDCSENINDETIYENLNSELIEKNTSQDVDINQSAVNNLCDSLVINTIYENTDTGSEWKKLSDGNDSENLVQQSIIDEFDAFKTADQGISICRSNENITEKLCEEETSKNIQDSDFDEFGSFVDFQRVKPPYIEPETTTETQFAEFSLANFEVESNENPPQVPLSIITKTSSDLSEDDFDDFTGFETAPTVNISDDFADFNAGPVIPDIDPIENLKKDRKKFLETVTKTITKAFGTDGNKKVPEIPTRDLLKTGALWQYIEDVEHTRAFQYQWDESKSCEALLGALNIDTRNILQRGGKLGGAVPRFAAYLGPDPLEPSPVVPSSAPTQNVSPPEVPAAQFDWNDAGLVNPLDRTVKQNVPEQLPRENIQAPEIVTKPVHNISDDDSVNSLKLGEYDPEPPVQHRSEAQISDSDDDFTDFRSSAPCPEPMGSVTLRETHISSKDNAPAWLQPTILTPELTRKSVPESQRTQDLIENKNMTIDNVISKEKGEVITEEDDFTDFQSVPLQNPIHTAHSILPAKKSKSTEIKPTEVIYNTNATNLLTPIVTSPLPLTPEVLRPIKKDPVIEINWPEPGVISDVPIDLVETHCKSISNNSDTMNVGSNSMMEPSLLIKTSQDQSEKTNIAEPLNVDRSKSTNNLNVDDEDWSDFVSVRTDVNKMVPSKTIKTDQLYEKPEIKTLNSLDASSLSQQSKFEMNAVKNHVEAQFDKRKPVLNSLDFSSNHHPKQEMQDFTQQKVMPNQFNIQSFRETKPDKSQDVKRNNYFQHHEPIAQQKKIANPFLFTNHTIGTLKPEQSSVNRQNNVQQQNSGEDDWSDFVSGGQPMTQRSNIRPPPPRFVSWNAPTVPNIITNPAHFDMYRAPSDDIPTRSNAARPNPNSISTISALPDLDFMTPGGMIWPRSSLSKK